MPEIVDPDEEQIIDEMNKVANVVLGPGSIVATIRAIREVEIVDHALLCMSFAEERMLLLHNYKENIRVARQLPRLIGRIVFNCNRYRVRETHAVLGVEEFEPLRPVREDRDLLRFMFEWNRRLPHYFQASVIRTLSETAYRSYKEKNDEVATGNPRFTDVEAVINSLREMEEIIMWRLKRVKALVDEVLREGYEVEPLDGDGDDDNEEAEAENENTEPEVNV